MQRTKGQSPPITPLPSPLIGFESLPLPSEWKILFYLTKLGKIRISEKWYVTNELVYNVPKKQKRTLTNTKKENQGQLNLIFLLTSLI